MSASYYDPLLGFLDRQAGPPFRVEIPFTRFHREAFEVAPRFPLARGWERQLDMARNPLFYGGGILTGAQYYGWLRGNAVRYVAISGGRLTITTRNVEVNDDPTRPPRVRPGSYAVLSVRDTGSGMGPTLNTAAAMDGYTLSDRGTWLSFKNKQNLTIVVEGDRRLFNQYGVMLVNPQKHPHVKRDLGEKFIGWLTSESGQQTIASYKINGAQLFFPDVNGPAHTPPNHESTL